jgi:N,N-dimethylformamidase beta subunit-like, C-terminal/Domain of unknown function (DUF4082)/Viral BACON domain
MSFQSGSVGWLQENSNGIGLPTLLAQPRANKAPRSTSVIRFVLIALAILASAVASKTASAQIFGCTPAMANDIVCENSKPGNSSGEWDLNQLGGADDMEGFATDISVNQGGTIKFKINTTAKAYTIDIYRMGYYQGNGARHIIAITPSATLPQKQPACLTNASVGLTDCGNWAVSASWTVPSNATSGIYFAHLVRTDNGDDNHIVFIVRNDSSHSDVLFQTGDESWQAYNAYGGQSLYGELDTFDLPNRAYKVSYNRPVITRGFEQEAATWVFGAEYPMVRWLEANGYNVTYFTGIDAARNGSLIQNHKMYMDAGHDEYWSGPHRTNVEAARNAGVNMAFFSGNEVFWKTRLENSIDGTNTPNRTLVCYKETLAFAKIDPQDPPTWTGTWRDPSFSPPADGGRPENSLTGTIFAVNGTSTDNPGTQAITVLAADGKMRFWRNTRVATLAPNTSYTLPAQTLGYEWDIDSDNGARPAGAFQLSTTTYALTTDLLLDYGATYGAGSATHHLMTYRASSGALVFGAGTVQWSWGLDSTHDDPFGIQQDPDVNMQQATVNLFADMGVQPATLQAGLSIATASTDKTPPTSTIGSPSNGSSITTGSETVSGTATDSGGGVVAGVEVSIDGGNTWHPATGRSTWSYAWSPAALGSVTIKTRAVDDSGNLETPSAGVTVTVVPQDCPCSGWGSSTVPSTPDSGDRNSVEVGVKFKADYNGFITGIRFYKSAANTGTHVGNLWTTSGTLLGSAIFSNETSSGWQQVNFSTPVAITANTVYVASYFAPVGHYAADSNFFATAGIDDPPIHLLANGVSGPDGIYSYGSSSLFPTATFNSTNYWVDVAYMPSTSMPGAPPALLLNPSSLTFTAQVGGGNPASQSISLYDEGTGSVNWTASSSASWLTASATSGTTPYTMNVSVNTSGLAAGTYTGTITINATGNNPTQKISVTLNLTNVLMATSFGTQGLQGWVTSSLGLGNDWSIVSQSSVSTAQFNGAGSSQIFAGNTAWSNYTISAPVKFATMNNYPGGIRGRVNPATGAGYMLWLYPASGQLVLYRATGWNINSGLVQIGAGTGAFDTTNFHNVALTFNGSQIQVSYDGKSIISATDSTYTSGLVALEGFSQVISFGDLLVTSPTANSGSLTPSPTSLTYSVNYAAANPAAQAVQLTAGGGGILAWSAVSNASWLTVSSSGGVTPGSLQVAVNSSTLAPGTFTGTISVVSLGAVTTAQTIHVSLTVIAPPPAIVPSPSSFNFVAMTGQAAPPSQTLAVTNIGTGNFSYTVSTDSSWLTATPASGSTPGSVTVSVSSSGLATGNYTGHVIITASGIANSPQSIPVNLQVLSQDMTETFNDSATGWIISPMGGAAGWSVSNGVYSFNGSGLSQSCSGNTGWTNYTFDTNIQLSNLSNWPGGVRARVNPSTGAGYVVWLYPATSQVILYKVAAWSVNDASLTQIGQGAQTFTTTGSHDLQVALYGSSITVSWDGKVIISATDSSYTTGFVCMDADSQPISYSNIRVAAVQSQATLATTPSASSIAFSAMPGNTPAPQTFNITAGGATTTWGASVTSSSSWLNISASSTLTPGVLTVSANTTGLGEGVYNGTIVLSAPGAANSPITIPVTLALKTAVMSVAPTSMTFFGAPTLNPTSQTFQVNNIGTGSLGWTATPSSNWIGLSSTTGSAPSVVTVAPNTSTVSTGTHNDTITISSPDVNNSPATISILTQVGNLLFSDNFSSGAGNWTVGPLGNASGWSVVNGTYTYNGAGPTQSWAGSSSWTDYTVDASFQLSNISNYPGGIRGRVNPTTGTSYAVWVYPAQGTVRLFNVGQWSIDGSNLTQLGVASGLVTDTNVHNLRVCFQGSSITVYYDNVLVITATDSTYTQGAIALDVYSQPIAFSNVSVISLP